MGKSTFASSIYVNLFALIFCYLFSWSLQAQLNVVPNKTNAKYAIGETVIFQISSNSSGTASYTIRYDEDASVLASGTVAVSNGSTNEFSYQTVEEGFLHCEVTMNGQSSETGAAIAPFILNELESEPNDFDAFWNNQKAQLANVAIDPQLSFYNSDPYQTTYEIDLGNIAGRRVYGYVSIPVGDGPFPAILTLPPFGSGASVVSPQSFIAERGGAISMSVSIHNVPANQTDPNAYEPNEIDSAEGNYYRFALMGAVRAVDYIFTRNDFDGQSMGVIGVSQGGGLATMLAGIDDRINLLAFSNPTHCNHVGLIYNKASGFPGYVNESQTTYGSPQHEAATVAATKYYDNIYFAKRYTGPVLAIISYEDQVCPPAGGFAAYNQFRGNTVLMHALDLGHVHPSEYWNGRFDFFRHHFPAMQNPPWPWPGTTTGYFANAGNDQTINSSNASLSGTIEQNGSFNTSWPVQWELVEGPGSVSFSNSTSHNTNANFSTNGTYTLRFSTTDESLLNSDQKYFTITDHVIVTVNNGTSQGSINFSCPNDITVMAAQNETGANVNWSTPNATTSCNAGGLNIQQTSGASSGSYFLIGTTTIIYEATDNCGNTEVCSFNVLVEDGGTSSITFSCPNDITVTAAQNETGANVNWSTPSGSTNCNAGGLNIQQNSGASSGSYFLIGTTTITYEATDNCGNTEVCNFNVTVQDGGTSLISFSCLNDITVTAAQNETGSNVNWSTPNATTTCIAGGLNIQQISGASSGSYFLIGTTTITYEATDNCGNIEICSFNVIVQPGNDGGTYCDASSSQPWEQWIGNVNLGSINNNSDKSYYSNFTNLNTDVSDGDAISLSATYSYTGYDAYWIVWIDLNHDNIFQNGEVVFEQYTVAPPDNIGSDITDGIINIPSNALSGSTRMRVALRRDDFANPCGIYTYGEVEDYMVNVIGGGNNAVLTFNCPNDITVTTAQDQTESIVTWATPTGTTTCNNANVNLSQISGSTSGSYFSVGTTTISYEASDNCGNTEVCSFDVIVLDGGTSSLNLSCPNDITVTTAQDQTESIVTWATPTGTTTCNNANVNVNQTNGATSGSYFSIGTTTIIYEATDNCGNTETCNFDIVVLNGGTSSITFNCPNDIIVTTAQDQTGSIVTWATLNGTTTCNTGSVNINQTNGASSGSYFSIGTTSISYEATDNCGNIEVCSFDVTVLDGGTSSLNLSCPSNILTTAGQDEDEAIVIWSTPEGSTNCNVGGFNISQTLGASSGSFFPIGTTNISYEATDNCGNTEICSFNVVVMEGGTSTLNLTCPNDITLTTAQDENNISVFWTEPNVSTTCIGGGLNIQQTDGALSGSSFSIGTTTINYLATDACGNVESCSFSVIVLDGGSSVLTLTCPNDIDVTTAIDENTIIVNWLNPESSTTCNSGVVALNQTEGNLSGEFFPIGTSTIIYEVVDDCGNVAYCSFDINVESGGTSSTELTINCPADLIFTTEANTTGMNVNWTIVTSSTTCPNGITNLSQTEGPANGDFFEIGISTITFHVTDDCGNDRTCSFTITVLENTIITNPCNSQGEDASEEWIAQVAVGDINNNSSNSGYSDFTNIGTDLIAGGVHILSLTPGFEMFTFDEYWRIWIDFNQDGDFSDSGELVFNDISMTSINSTLNIPDNIMLGNTIMRVAMQRGAYSNPCADFPLGEVEDYSVRIVEGNTNENELPEGTCASQGDQPWWEWISNVNFGSIDNYSFKEGYGDYTDHTTAVTLGQTYPIILTPDFSFFKYDEYWKVWIDFNRDGDFDDVNEEVFADHSFDPLTGNINIPLSAQTGLTRMRVSMQREAYTDSCEDFDLGEVEDYSVLLEGDPEENIIPTYCEVEGLSQEREYCRQVVFSTINKISGSRSYTDYSEDHIANVTRGDAYTIYLKPRYLHGPSKNEYWMIWIDYNQNGNFEEDEVAFSDVGKNTRYGDVQIPISALTGTTRMRVAMSPDDYPDPCTTFANGEVEDYGVEISNSSIPLVYIGQEFLQFSAEKKNRKVELNWSTNTEFKNEYFIIERSTDGVEYFPLKHVISLENGIAPLYYSEVDQNPNLGLNYYRLKQTFTNGSYIYSSVREVEFEIDLLSFSVFPNPSTDKVYVNLKEFADLSGTIEVYNSLGQAVLKEEMEAIPSYPVLLELGNLSGGAYHLTIQIENKKIRSQSIMIGK